MLTLNHLYLKDFMCCREIDLNFPPSGLVILQGENGQGKSAVLEAIAVCFMEHRRSDSFKEYVRLSAKEAIIKLDCLYGQQSLLFEMKIGGRGGTFRDLFYQNKHYLNSEVSQLLSSLELDFYAEIILSLQDSHNITNMTPVQRAALLQKLFQFDFEKELEQLNNSIDDWTVIKEKSIKEEEICQNLIESKSRSFEDKKEQSLSIDKIEFYKSKLENFQLFFEEDIYQKYNSLLEDIKLDNQKAFNLKNKLSEIDQNKIQLESLKKDLSQIEEQLNCFDSKDFQSKEIEIKNSITELETQLELDKEAENSCQLKINQKTFEKKELSYRLELAENGCCPTCGQEIKNIDLNQIKTDLEILSTEFLKLKDSINNLKIQIKEKSKKISIEKEKLNQLSIDRHNQEFKLAYLLEAKEKLSKSISNFQFNPEENQQLNQDLDKLNRELLAKEQLLAEFKLKIDQLNSAKKEKESYEKIIADFNYTEQLNSIIERKNNQLKQEIQELESKIVQLKSQRTQAVKQIDNYKEAKKVLDIELPNYLIIKTCAKLEDAMNTFIQIIFPDITVMLKKSKKGVDFFFTRDTELLSAKMASGFEKAVLSIAFKVALCQAYGISFAALDEIDSAASKENSEKLFNSLISENVFQQLIIITHKESVCDIVKNISNQCQIYRVNQGNFTLDY